MVKLSKTEKRTKIYNKKIAKLFDGSQANPVGQIKKGVQWTALKGVRGSEGPKK